jgi:hypothetical protein
MRAMVLPISALLTGAGSAKPDLKIRTDCSHEIRRICATK